MMPAKNLCLFVALCALSNLVARESLASSPVQSGGLANQEAGGDTGREVGSGHGKSIKFRPILSSQYANFPVNWAANKVYRLALLRSAGEYDQVFHAAAVGGSRQPYAPAPELYEQEMILVVSRVTSARANLDKALEIASVIAKGKTLEVTFKFHEGSKSATYSVKVTGAARIPKQEVDRVLFFEGKKLIGELQVDKGQWVVPEVE